VQKSGWNLYHYRSPRWHILGYPHVAANNRGLTYDNARDAMRYFTDYARYQWNAKYEELMRFIQRTKTVPCSPDKSGQALFLVPCSWFFVPGSRFPVPE
jgi:hypothetical protein